MPGQPGHGSLLLDNTPGEKVAYILNKFYEFRRAEQKKLKDNPTFTVGDVTTVNLTQIHVSTLFFKKSQQHFYFHHFFIF